MQRKSVLNMYQPLTAPSLLPTICFAMKAAMLSLCVNTVSFYEYLSYCRRDCDDASISRTVSTRLSFTGTQLMDLLSQLHQRTF